MSASAIEIRRESFFRLELPYREGLSLERAVFRGGDGPRVCIVSGIHGDELEGLYVCHRLAERVEEIAGTRPGALQGSIELYPALNPLGLDTLQRRVPIYDVDLNRSFPGHPSGLLPQRLAHAAMEALLGAALVVDIHASNIYLREIPQVRIARAFEPKLVPIARRMNLDLIWVHEAMTVLESTIAHSLNERGTPCLVAEMGVGMRVTPAFAEQVVTGILHVARELGALHPELELEPAPHVPLVADDGNVHYLNAETSGLFVPAKEHWKIVAEGELLGRIVSPLHGEVRSEVRSPTAGVLFTLREYPLVYEGSLLARIMRTENPR
jgi:predicted deacylase